MIELACGHCGRRGVAKDEWAGRSVRCTGCGEAIVVPGESASPAIPRPEPPSQVAQAPRTPPNSPPAVTARPNPATAPRRDVEKKSPRTPPAARTAPAAPASRAPSPVRQRQPSGTPPPSRRVTTPEIVEATEVVDPLPLAGGLDDLLSDALADSVHDASAFGGSPLAGPLGAVTARPRTAKRKSSSAILWIVMGVVGGLAVVAAVIVVMVVMA